MYAMTGLYSDTGADDSSADAPHDESECGSSILDQSPDHPPDTVIKCHSRQPSSSLVDREKQSISDDEDSLIMDCGILNCRPKVIQQFARIKVSLRNFFFQQNEEQEVFNLI